MYSNCNFIELDHARMPPPPSRIGGLFLKTFQAWVTIKLKTIINFVL